VKRLLCACVAVLALVVAACGSNSSSSSSSADGSSSSGDERIALVTGDNHDPFYVTMNKGAQAAAKKYGVKVTWQGPPTFEAQPQISILDALFSSKPDALLVAPTDTKALVGTLGQFTSAKIPVITVDTDVNQPEVRLGNITSNNQLGGKLAVDYFVKKLPSGSKVAFIGGPPGVFTIDERQKGFEAAVKSSGLNALEAQHGQDDDANTATALVNALMQRNPDLKGIFASDTAYGAGAATAVQNAGKAGKVQIVAFDAEPDEVQALRRGTIQALVVQKAYDMGVQAVTYAVKQMRDGAAVPKSTNPSYVIATKDNIDSPAVEKYIYAQK
jgi:ribose transport system substrate-binding protein